MINKMLPSHTGGTCERLKAIQANVKVSVFIEACQNYHISNHNYHERLPILKFPIMGTVSYYGMEGILR